MNPREIYEVFTKEHGVPLSYEAMRSILELKNVQLEELAKSLSESCPNKVVTKEDVAKCVKKSATHKSIKVERVLFAPSGCARFRYLKERFLAKKTPIAALKEGKEATVFGMVKVGEKIALEDEDEEIEIGEIEEEEYFLATGVCAGFRGAVADRKFNVSKIELPYVERKKTAKKEERESEDGENNVIFISEFTTAQENVKELENMLEVYRKAGIQIACVVLMVKIKDTLENEGLRIERGLADLYKRTEFVVIPGSTERPLFYPQGEYKKNRNTTLSTNPSKISVGQTVLLVGSFEITDGVKKHCALQGEYRENLGRVVLSQASYNPFVHYTDLSCTEEYDHIVIGDRYDSYLHQEKERVFAVCGEFGKNGGQFLFYSDASGTFEVSTLKRNSA